MDFTALHVRILHVFPFLQLDKSTEGFRLQVSHSPLWLLDCFASGGGIGVDSTVLLSRTPLAYAVGTLLIMSVKVAIVQGDAFGTSWASIISSLEHFEGRCRGDSPNLDSSRSSPVAIQCLVSVERHHLRRRARFQAASGRGGPDPPHERASLCQRWTTGPLLSTHATRDQSRSIRMLEDPLRHGHAEWEFKVKAKSSIESTRAEGPKRLPREGGWRRRGRLTGDFCSELENDLNEKVESNDRLARKNFGWSQLPD